MSTALSDFNKNGSKRTAHRNLYSDLNIALPIHPTLNDITPLRDIDAVKNSVKNLLMTNQFEKPFHPEIGSNITGYLFEPIDQITAVALKGEIKRVLEEFEPRINVTRVQCFPDIDNNRYEVTIGFNVNYFPDEPEVNFYLERLR